MRRILFLLLTGSLLVSVAWAAAGESSADFLKIGVGGRPVAMGEAYTALAEGASAAYWNPAGLSRQEVFEVLSMHSSWFYDTQFQYIGFASPFGRLGNIGMSYSLVNYGSIVAYNASGSKEADVTAADSALALSWAKEINKKLSLGVNLKSVSETLDTFSASTTSLDIGLLLKLSKETFLGINLQNQLGGLKFLQTENSLPRKVTVGLSSAHFILEPLTVTLDYNLPYAEDNYLNYGCEYYFNDFFALRFGSSHSRLQGGIGFGAPSFRLDYAYTPYEDLGATHRLSFTLQFGVEKKKEIEKHYKLGKKYYREQEFLDALAEFKKVLDLDSLNKDSREFVDRIIEEMRIKTLREKVRSLREEKKKAGELLQKAVAEFQQKNYNRARELVKKSLEFAPKNKKALELKGRLEKVLKIKK